MIEHNSAGQRSIELYREYIPEHYETNTNASLTIRCKKSESSQIEYDLTCVLYDAAANHPFFKGTKIIDNI